MTRRLLDFYYYSLVDLCSNPSKSIYKHESHKHYVLVLFKVSPSDNVVKPCKAVPSKNRAKKEKRIKTKKKEEKRESSTADSI